MIQKQHNQLIYNANIQTQKQKKLKLIYVILDLNYLKKLEIV